MVVVQENPGTSKFQFASKNDAKIQQSIILYLNSDAGKKILTEVVKNVSPISTKLDKRTKESIKNNLKVEVIREVRDQFLEAVSKKIEDSVNESDVKDQVGWYV